eukprot:XP_011661069.1 PREDICTED: serine/threonine-protein kinase TNNI3K-like [Strongylocentrotus purpuratus]
MPWVLTSHDPLPPVQEWHKKISESYAVLEARMKEDLDPKDIEQYTGIQKACCAGDTDRVLELADERCVVSKTETGLTLLHLSCISTGSKPFVKLLVHAGARVSSLSRNGFSPLHLACFQARCNGEKRVPTRLLTLVQR